MIISPAKKERRILRMIILVGLLSFANFFYWLVNPSLIEYRILFWLLMITIIYDSLRTIYLWYYYWDLSMPEKPELKSNFTVDILTTYFPGEPYDMIKDTLLAIQKIKYPHTTYLCDEANDEHLKSFCQEHHIVHVTRNNRIDAKAGNINNALKQATGEICLILDPDHVPKEDILDELIPYFEDEKIGFVQSVQAYYNINESLVARGAAEQTFLFYGPIMMGMNSHGTVNAIGANCCFRRKALDSIGGHAPGLSEDMHTAMQLHAKGWKSVYVPKALTKGLVPATITSYYKQQLKWSRGTLDLLFSVYPKLFKQFTLRQKIHYGILPLHYLSGIIYLIAFLIPVISLYMASIPWKGNILDFAVMFLPVISSIILVKLYIEKWLIHKSERGIHLVGGILQACTWWIFSVGFIYTIIGKKVPYLPTPKENQGDTHFAILLPNLFIILLSVSAIIYGLSIDFTPFSVFMSGFAVLNIIFMLYSFVFAYEKSKAVTFSFNSENTKTNLLNRAKTSGLRALRKMALPVIVLILITSVSAQYYEQHLRWKIPPPTASEKAKINYFGIFAPAGDSGITGMKKANQVAHDINVKFSLISIYLAWNQDIQATFPEALLDSIYRQESLPVITWEPWMNTFDLDSRTKENKSVFELVAEGYFDNYLTDFSVRLKNLQRPVFLRFAHEFDNPFYPWYSGESHAASSFKKAWVHVYEVFKKNGAHNVIWVWNPWKPENVAAFYPGEEYVDWLGVNILNYGQYNPNKENVSFSGLYEPFHEEFKKLPDTPVLVSELGTQGDKQYREQWFDEAFAAIENDFQEISSLIFFNSSFDSNWPANLDPQDDYLDWTIPQNLYLADLQRQNIIQDYIFTKLPELDSSGNEPIIISKQHAGLSDIVGINLKKGHDWRVDFDVLDRKNLLRDFNKIEKLGINTLKYEGNSIYDYNVLNISKDFNFKISMAFWIFSDIDFVKSNKRADDLKKMILGKIHKYKDRENITSWNIQNDVLYNQKDSYHKPELLYQNLAYIVWLRDLIREIKKIDTKRPVFVDLEVSQEAIYHSKLLLTNIPEIDALGLVVKNDVYLNPLKKLLTQFGVHYVYSEIREKSLADNGIYDSKEPFFITAWQDQYEENKLFMDGITDRNARYKADYFNLYHAIHQSGPRVNELKTRILRPATPIYKNQSYVYHAMVYDDSTGWKSGYTISDLKFEWSLLRCDINGNYTAIKEIGQGPVLSLQVPSKYEYYRLMLTTINADTITSTITTLNTPLYYEN